MAEMQENGLNQERNILEIIKGREHELLSEQDIMDASKLMYPAFQDALTALRGILDSSINWHKSNNAFASGQSRSSDNKQENNLYGYANNILAFCASRGQGKTSAMLSFSNALANYNHNEDDTHPELARKLMDCCFYTMPPIDPTMLGDGESIIELILSRLLGRINELWQHPEQAASLPAHRKQTHYELELGKIEALKNFDICVDGLRREVGKDSDKGTERLLQAKDIFDLKRSIHEIITYYFRLRGRDAKNSFLVIQLDDTDMQFKNAYNILEEVRKFLSIPNVVVLMATDLDQLSRLVDHHYRRTLGNSSDTDDSNGKFDIQRMAGKYIDKLIPASQAVFLPTMQAFWEPSTRIHVSINSDDEKKTKVGDLERVIFDLIYEKTGLVFIRHDDYSHEILPSTLRGISHLHRLLASMKAPLPIAYSQNVDEYKSVYLKNARDRLRNLVVFENYFLNDWAICRLSYDGKKVLNVLDSTRASSRIDVAIKEILHRIKGKSWEDVKPKADDSEAVYIKLIKMLKSLESHYYLDEDIRFLFAVRTYFSIQLNKQAMLDEIAAMSYMPKNIEEEEYRYNVFKEKMPFANYSNVVKMLTGKPLKKHEPSLTAGAENFKNAVSLLAATPNKGSSKNVATTEDGYGIIRAFIDLMKCDFKEIDKLHKTVHKSVSYYLRLSRYLVYISCNYEVQYQFLHNLTQKFNNNDLNERATDFFGEFSNILKGKEAVLPYGNTGAVSSASVPNFFVVLTDALGFNSDLV